MTLFASFAHFAVKRSLPGAKSLYLATTGSTSADGCSASCNTTFVALTNAEPESVDLRYRGAPVFKFRSNRGKLLLETSSRSTCPFLKTLLVAHMSIENL